MSAPSADAIVTDPPPLNATEFPFRVDAFPAQWLAEFGGLIPVVTASESVDGPANPHRYER